MVTKIIKTPSKQSLSSISADKRVLAQQLETGTKRGPQSQIYFSEPHKIAISKVAGKIHIPGINVADHCDCICHCDCTNCLCDCSCTVCDCGACGTACSCSCDCNPGYCDCSVCECDCDCITPEKAQQVMQAARQLTAALGLQKAAKFGDVVRILSSFQTRQ